MVRHPWWGWAMGSPQGHPETQDPILWEIAPTATLIHNKKPAFFKSSMKQNFSFICNI